jgi:gluconate 2-dehydrogenase gamma chain
VGGVKTQSGYGNPIPEIPNSYPPSSRKGTEVEAAFKLSRRRFIQAAMAAAAVGSDVACTATRSPWRFLTVDEARTLAAVCDQIIPPDQDPGAAWAGVVNYMDRQLCGPFKDLRKTYRQGIAAVDETSLTRYGASFVDLTSARQVELLSMMEEGRVPGEVWKHMRSAEFFALLVDHTMQGFYGDPRHGGNREGASWKMLGVPYPPIRGRLKYDLTTKP